MGVVLERLDRDVRRLKLSGDPATITAAGSMSAADKAKLDALKVPTQRLFYNAAGGDLLNGSAITMATWTDIHANQSFTLGSATAWLVVEIKLGLVATSAGQAQISARALFNSGGTAIGVPFNTGMVSPAGGFDALSSGTFYIAPASFPTGENTVKVQIYGNAALTAYCRCNTVPNNEWLTIQVLELSV